MCRSPCQSHWLVIGSRTAGLEGLERLRYSNSGRFLDESACRAYRRLAHPHLEDSRLRHVGVGRRAIAQLIDIVFSLLWWVPFAKIDHLSGGGYQLTWTIGRSVVPFIISAVYFVLMEGLIGATVGKFIVGVRVTAADGTAMGWGASATRNLLRVVDGFPYAIPYLVGAVAIWTGGSTKRRLGDRAARTVVIRAGSEPPAGGIPAVPNMHELSAEAPAPPLPSPPGSPDGPAVITNDLPSM